MGRYSQSDLDLSLVNPDILKQRRGAGFWCWKPAILLQALNSLDADYVFYMDANERPTANHVKTLLQACGVSKFAGFRFHPRQWPSMRPYTKRDCFVGMQCDSEKFWDATKVHAGFICFRVSDAAALFLKEWNFYCSIPELVTDMPSVAPNFEEFIEHRHDQSILTNLVTLVLDKNTRDLMELLTQDIEIPAEYS